MFVLLSSLQNDNAIVSISCDSEKIAFLDTHNIFYMYDRKSLKRTAKKKLVAIKEAKHLYHRGSSLSKEMDIFISSQNTGSAVLVNLDNSPILTEKFKYNKKAIYFATFSHDSTMLAFGGEDGKFYLYDKATSDVSALIDIQSDYISAINFSLSKHFIAISSYNKKTIVYDTFKHKQIATLELPVAAETVSFSSDESYLLLLSREKVVYKYIIGTQELLESSFFIEGWASTIFMIEDEFCVVGTRSNKLYLINHSDFSLLGVVEFEKSGISQVYGDASTIIVSFIDGEVFLIDTLAYLDEFTMHLSLHEFQRAREYLEYNIFLYTSQAIKTFDIQWKKVLDQAKELLVKNQQLEANNLVKPFFFDQKKKEEYEACKLNSPIYSRFLLYLQAYRYADAYNLIESTPENDFLKTSKEYKRLEKEWFLLYKECKGILMKHDVNNVYEAKKRLQPFMGVKSKQTLIIELLQNYKIFQLSDNYVRTRNFKSYFALVSSYAFLKMEEVYKRVLEIGESTYTRLITLEQNMKLDEAVEIASFLLDFTPMKEEIALTLQRLKQKKKLQLFIENNKVREVYEYIQKHPDLENSTPFEKFHRHFLSKLKVAKSMSENAEILKMKNLFEEYLGLEYTQDALAYLFRWAYIKEIILTYEKKDAYLIDFEQTIRHFYSFFGRHSDLFTSFQKANIEAILNIDDEIEYPEDAYKEKEFVRTILINK